MDTQDIIAKIKKLQGLSQSTNVFEAANAAAAANKLIDQYRISSMDLEFSQESSEEIENDLESVYETGKITKWKEILLLVVSKHYGCIAWNSLSFPAGRKVSSFHLTGRRSDIAITKHMFAWLQSECIRLSEQNAKGNGRVFVSSYCLGFVSGISQQLINSRNDLKQSSTEQSMIKLNARYQEASDYLNSNAKIKTVPYKSSARIDNQAYQEGNEQGKSLHLGESIDASIGGKLLGS